MGATNYLLSGMILQVHSLKLTAILPQGSPIHFQGKKLPGDRFREGTFFSNYTPKKTSNLKNHLIEKEHHLKQTSILGFKILVFQGSNPPLTFAPRFFSPFRKRKKTHQILFLGSETRLLEGRQRCHSFTHNKKNKPRFSRGKNMLPWEKVGCFLDLIV